MTATAAHGAIKNLEHSPSSEALDVLEVMEGGPDKSPGFRSVVDEGWPPDADVVDNDLICYAYRAAHAEQVPGGIEDNERFVAVMRRWFVDLAGHYVGWCFEASCP